VLPAFTTVAAAHVSQWAYPHDLNIRYLARFGLIDEWQLAGRPEPLGVSRPVDAGRRAASPVTARSQGKQRDLASITPGPLGPWPVKSGPDATPGNATGWGPATLGVIAQNDGQVSIRAQQVRIVG
jgi:hypothetical protein